MLFKVRCYDVRVELDLGDFVNLESNVSRRYIPLLNSAVWCRTLKGTGSTSKGLPFPASAIPGLLGLVMGLGLAILAMANRNQSKT